MLARLSQKSDETVSANKLLQQVARGSKRNPKPHSIVSVWGELEGEGNKMQDRMKRSAQMKMLLRALNQLNQTHYHFGSGAEICINLPPDLTGFELLSVSGRRPSDVECLGCLFVSQFVSNQFRDQLPDTDFPAPPTTSARAGCRRGTF